MIDPNRDVNEVCAIILAGKQNGCVILGGGSPKNFYLQGQPTLWEVYGIPKGGNDYFIQITTDQVVWGGLSGATPAEAVSWGKVNPGVLPDTVVAYCDSTIAFPLFCEYAIGSERGTPRAEGARPQARRARRRPVAAGDAAKTRRNRFPEQPATSMPSTDETSTDGDAVIRVSARIAATSVAAPRIYADANIPAGVVAFMRQSLGWDVLFVIEHDDLRRAPDVQHYRLARQLRRTIVTLDRDYFDDRRFPPEESGGVIVFQAPDERALMAPVDPDRSRGVPPGPRCGHAPVGPEASVERGHRVRVIDTA